MDIEKYPRCGIVGMEKLASIQGSPYYKDIFLICIQTHNTGTNKFFTINSKSWDDKGIQYRPVINVW